MPCGFPPICAPQGHGGERLVSGPRPLADSVNMHRHRIRGIECTAYPRGRTASPSVGVHRRIGALHTFGTLTVQRRGAVHSKGAAIWWARRGR